MARQILAAVPRFTTGLRAVTGRVVAIGNGCPLLLATKRRAESPSSKTQFVDIDTAHPGPWRESRPVRFAVPPAGALRAGPARCLSRQVAGPIFTSASPFGRPFAN